MSDSTLTVLVAVDFSETSRRAMAWAFDYGQRAPCAIHLVHVIERHLSMRDLVDTGVGGLREEIKEIEDVARRELEAMAPSREARESIGPLHEHVALGKPAGEILRLADELGADMIVMGTHGHTGVERLFVGSVAQRVVRAAPCTVVCVKPTTAKTEGAAT